MVWKCQFINVYEEGHNTETEQHIQYNMKNEMATKDTTKIVQ